MKKRTITHRAAALLFSVALLATLFCGIIPAVSAEGEATNVLLNNANVSVSAKKIAHTLNWAEYSGNANYTAAPDYSGKDLTDYNETFASGNTSGSDKLFDGIATGSYLKFTDDSASNAMANRYALLLDLGACYDLSEVKLHTMDSANRWIYNYSVYVGNAADNTLLDNCVGRGGGAATLVTAALSNASNARYMLIVFDHVGADPGNASDTANQTATNGPGPAGWEGATGVFFLTEIEAYGTATPTGPVPTNVLKNNESVAVSAKKIAHALNWAEYSGNTNYTAAPDYSGKDLTDYTEEALAGSAKLFDGDPTGLVKLREVDAGGDQMTQRYALLLDLGAYYDLSEVKLLTANSANRWIYNYSVYVGNAADNTLLDNCVGRGGGAETLVTAALDGATAGRYMLIVFDHVGADPGNSSDESEANKTATNGPGPAGWANTNGMILLYEIEAYGVEAELPSDPKLDIDANAVKMTQVEIKLDENFGWNQTFENGDFDYDPKNYVVTWENDSGVISKMFNGNVEEPAKITGVWGRTPENVTKRFGAVIDLGGFYDVSEIELITSQAVLNAGIFVYDYSVYGGAVNDGTLLNNLLGHYNTAEGTIVNGTTLTSDKSIRYLLLVFNKMGTDPGNLNEDAGEYAASGADQINREGALPGCTYADSRVFLDEIVLYGKVGTDPTDTDTYTDPDSGVKINVTTYDNDVLVESIKVTRKPVTNIQKTAVEAEGMYVVDDAYHIEFLDKDGQVITDMSGRQYTVSIPMQIGDENLFAIDALGAASLLAAEIDIETASLVYVSSDPEVFDFILATFTEPDGDDNDDDNGGFGGDDTDDNIGNTGDEDANDGKPDGDDADSPVTGENTMSVVLALLVLVSGATVMLVVSKKRTA